MAKSSAYVQPRTWNSALPEPLFLPVPRCPSPRMNSGSVLPVHPTEMLELLWILAIATAHSTLIIVFPGCVIGLHFMWMDLLTISFPRSPTGIARHGQPDCTFRNCLNCLNWIFG